MGRKKDIFRQLPRLAAREVYALFCHAKFRQKAELRTGKNFLLLILISLAVFGSQIFLTKDAQAANSCTWTGTVNSNWSNAGNWTSCGGVAPQAVDTVSFTSGSVASTVDVPFTVAAMTVNGYTGTITLGAALTINGNLSASSGTIDCGASPNNYTLTVGGQAVLSAGATINNGTIVAYDLRTNGGTYNGTTSLTKNGASVDSWSTGGNTFNGATTITNAAGSGYWVVNSSGTDTYNSDVTFVNNSTINAIWATHKNGTTVFKGNVASALGTGAHLNWLTWNTGASTVTFSGTGTQQLSGSWFPGISILNHNGSGTLQLNGSITVVTALNNSAGTLDLNGQNLTATGATFSNNNGTVKLRGSETITGLTQDSAYGTWLYVGNGDGLANTYDIKNYAYNNLTINATDGAIDTFRIPAADLTVNGAFTLTAGTFTTQDAGSVTRNIIVSGNMTVGGTLNANGSTVTVGGNWDSSGGTFNYSTSTVNLTGTGTVKGKGSWAAMDFYNLTVSASGQTTTVNSSPFIINNILTVGAGTLSYANKGVILMGNGSPLSLDPSSILSGSGGYIRFDGTTAQNMPGHTYGSNIYFISNNSPSLVVTMTGNVAVNGNLLFGQASPYNNNDATLNTSTNNYSLSVTGNITCADDGGLGYSSALVLNNSSATFSGSTINFTNMSLNAGTSTVTFNASIGIQTLNSNSSSFYNLIHSGAGTLQLANNLTVANNFINSVGTFDTNNVYNYSVNVTLDYNQSGGSVTAQSSTITVGRNFTANGGISSTGYNYASIVLTGAGNLAYTSLSSPWSNGFNNVTCGQSGNTTILTTNIGILSSLTIGTGALTGSYTISVDGNGNFFNFNSASTLSVGMLDFYANANVPTLNNGYSTSLNVGGSSVTPVQTGAIILNLGSSLNILCDNVAGRSCGWNTANYPLTVGGDLEVGSYNVVNTGTLTAGTSAINMTSGGRGFYIQNTASTFSGTGTITFSASSGTQYYWSSSSGTVLGGNLVHNSASTLQPWSNLSMAGTFTNSAGTFDDSNGSATTVGGLATVSGGTYLASTSTQTFNGGLTVSGGTFSGGTGAVGVTGDLNISGGTFTAPSTNLTITGNLTNNGTFTAGISTVTFNGAGTSTITGSATAPSFAVTFNNLTVSAGKTVKFGNGKYFKNLNSLALNGTLLSPVTVTSDDSLNKWYINHQGTETISYVNLDHSGCDYTNSPYTKYVAMVGTNSTNNGNNDSCWDFGSLSITPMSVGDFPSVTLSGSATSGNATMTPFSVNDSRGTGAGWNVTVQATQFKEYVGGTYVVGGKTLALSSLSMAAPTVAADGTSSPPPTMTAGPYVIDSGAAVKIASAAVITGMGTYDFTPGTDGLTLSIPANAYATTYRSEVTVSVVSGP